MTPEDKAVTVCEALGWRFNGPVTPNAMTWAIIVPKPDPEKHSITTLFFSTYINAEMVDAIHAIIVERDAAVQRADAAERAADSFYNKATYAQDQWEKALNRIDDLAAAQARVKELEQDNDRYKVIKPLGDRKIEED